MKIHLITLLLFLTLTTTARASGWNDYERDIGDGYSIFRANSFDLSISYNSSHLIGPSAFSEIGPVYGYYVTDDHIFARAYGRKMRNKFEGDTFEEIDRSKQFYFVLRKGVNEITGPLSLEGFQQNDIAKQHSPIQWTAPRNPNFWLPLLGSLMFLMLLIPIMAIKFYWITIPVILVLTLFIRHIRKKRKQKAQPKFGQVSPETAPSSTPDEPSTQSLGRTNLKEHPKSNSKRLARPPKVGLAVKLLYVSTIGIQIIRHIIESPLNAEDLSVGLVGFFLAILFYEIGLMWFLIYMIGKGKNWARITFLVLFILVIPFSILPMAHSLTHEPISGMLGLVQFVMQVLAIMLLFQGASSSWFKAMKQTKTANAQQLA